VLIRHVGVGLVLRKQRGSKLGRAVAPRQPAQLAADRAAGAIGILCSGLRKGRAVGAAHGNQQALGLFAQGLHIHAGRDREQDVRGAHPFALAEARVVRLEIAPAGGLIRLRQLDLALQQLLDSLRGGFAEHPIDGRLVANGQQAGTLRGLPQQLAVGALAQRFRVRRFTLAVQGHAVHAGHQGLDVVLVRVESMSVVIMMLMAGMLRLRSLHWLGRLAATAATAAAATSLLSHDGLLSVVVAGCDRAAG